MADTRRDIIQRVKVNADDVSNYADWLQRVYTGDPAVAGPTKTLVDGLNANLAACTAAMAAFAAAAP
jgi:hypothetical protein